MGYVFWLENEKWHFVERVVSLSIKSFCSTLKHHNLV